MLDKFMSQVTYYVAGFLTLVLSNLDTLAIIVGITCTIFTTWANWYYKCKADYRDSASK